MAGGLYRVVIDTNTLLRGVIAADSSAATIRRPAESRELIPLLSKPVLDEYRAVLASPLLVDRFPPLGSLHLDYLIERLTYIGEYVRMPTVRFRYIRDPLDEKFIEFAIALRATHIITGDNDLLTLPTSRSDAGRRFRQRLPEAYVMKAGEFLFKYKLG